MSETAPPNLAAPGIRPSSARRAVPGVETDLTADQLRDLYRALLLPRIIEEKMLLLIRQARISKWFSGVGQEAIAVGVASALEPDDFILPMHRNLGVFTTRGVDLGRLFRQLLLAMGASPRGATARSTSDCSSSASSA
jgi:TPP-dependent pyruvate/acetoin dehydrogenase alpha subunit